MKREKNLIDWWGKKKPKLVPLLGQVDYPFDDYSCSLTKQR
jgi:hypothetical protein